MCQTISSFANSQGGWLFVGISDSGAYVGIEKQRADFSQMISEKLMSVTPVPKFDCRFISEKTDEKRGVLSIQVCEGINPPYICNGTIYIRSGSSKLPIKSERNSIDDLINKRERFNKVMEKFCVNNFISGNTNIPYCTIYLFDPCSERNYENYDEKIDGIKNYFIKENEKSVISESMESVLRLGLSTISANTGMSIEEYSIDDNIKIFMPLFMLNNNGAISTWIETVEEYNEEIHLNNMKIVDGMITYLSLFSMLSSAFGYIKEQGKKVSDYQIVFEYKNILNTVFYHKHNWDKITKEEFVQDVKNNVFYVCRYSEIKADPVFIRKEFEDENVNSYVSNLLEMKYLKLFGISYAQFSKILEQSEGKYDEGVFSTETYEV